jgi:hypothetical protein
VPVTPSAVFGGLGRSSPPTARNPFDEDFGAPSLSAPPAAAASSVTMRAIASGPVQVPIVSVAPKFSALAPLPMLEGAPPSPVSSPSPASQPFAQPPLPPVPVAAPVAAPVDPFAFAETGISFSFLTLVSN